MPNNDQTKEAPELCPDATRREILTILSESGLTPGQGIEGMIDRFIRGGAAR
ncbi:hypothetical protein [Sinisalibacter aestuarii]|uniref:Uncharacterized protein n=1 Tax=Sinisalibacter aestuarii TaxID=2949426 RepID=A0ABQ5LP54_9RHOB|nr:hypothetical protein [Sinisalibacter aestuarii]GKY86724.1 hypothetical protein STA1M1_05930 [Sinisalibacter aestuarii]